MVLPSWKTRQISSGIFRCEPYINSVSLWARAGAWAGIEAGDAKKIVPQRMLHINKILTSHMQFTESLPAICRPTWPPVNPGWGPKSTFQGLRISVALVYFQRHHTLAGDAANPGWLLSRNCMYAIQAKAGIRVYLLAISPFPVIASSSKYWTYPPLLPSLPGSALLNFV